ncbi:MAG: Eco57I restriction-modification methylase domain-containing protein [Chloroherpetonaceae bacterium]|nr:Eco57I restriction-modification methylase domain-containing protein [Chloroherpetonaceae bacterium]
MMSLPRLNELLSKFSEGKRDHILAFSSALLEWMGIPAEPFQKPPLITPQTQKLREWLAGAPITNQAQLFRLSAYHTKILVRFAVLKKIRKDTLVQLVDNDPGLTSYQAFESLMNAGGEGSPAALPSTRPYFIHFVTTPDYQKLFIVLNKGNQKRIITFANRLTVTQHEKILHKWQGIERLPKPDIATVLWESLDIKEVNKEFYKAIKESFDKLLGLIRYQYPAIEDRLQKQFAIRLIGRYIFCWFLKEKGIIPTASIGTKAIDANPDFFNTILSALFFKTLNTKVEDRAHTEIHPFAAEHFSKVPYLNGGLFDFSAEDRAIPSLSIDVWLLEFVSTLESYDFTVDESSSTYQQVAVDPEMLGRIFENLLASQNQETEQLANDRKAFGAFYTPREIVDYMVRESLKTFLASRWEEEILSAKTEALNNPEPTPNLFGEKPHQQLSIPLKKAELSKSEKKLIDESLTKLFSQNPEKAIESKEDRQKLLRWIEDVKILDPACGSGAFPMGALHQLVELNEALGTLKTRYELKKDILSHNIYGVDIMPMATEIARLRAWLSLVLDEEYKPIDTKHNFNLKPLPNLDFKFICADTLIGLGLEELEKTSEINIFFEAYKKHLTELQTLRNTYYDHAHDPEKKALIKAKFENTKQSTLTDLKEGPPLFASIAARLDVWDPFNDSIPSPFFDKNWMFGISKGFDVIIGNPPYLRIQGIRKVNSAYANLLASIFNSATGSFDLYVLFVERGLELLTHRGILNYIMPVKWTNSAFGKGLREVVKNYKAAQKIISFEAYQVFNASTYTGLQWFIPNSNHLNYFQLNRDLLTNEDLHHFLNELDDSRFNTFNPDSLSLEGWILSDNQTHNILKKIQQQPLKVKDIFEKIFQGIATSKDSVYFLLNCTNSGYIIKGYSKELDQEVEIECGLVKPLLKGDQVHRYETLKTNNYVIFPYKLNNGKAALYTEQEIKTLFPKGYAYLKKNEQVLRERENGKLMHDEFWFRYIYPKNLTLFDKPKLICPYLGLKSQFSSDLEGIFYGNTKCFGLIKKSGIILDYHYLIGLLNSELLWYFLKNTGTIFRGGYFAFTPDYLNAFGIAKPDSVETEKQIVELVKTVIAAKSVGEETAGFEREIDEKVYALYGLTAEEIAVVVTSP